MKRIKLHFKEMDKYEKECVGHNDYEDNLKAQRQAVINDSINVYAFLND